VLRDERVHGWVKNCLFSVFPSYIIMYFSYEVIEMTKHESLTFKLEKSDRELLERVCRVRGESLSSFVRRALRMEFARLGLLSREECRALGFQGEEPQP